MLKDIFTWWIGATIGARNQIRRSSKLVGHDEFGNAYYESTDKKFDYDGRNRRFVIYKGYADASKVGADWHGWLHHTVDISPVDEKVTPQSWWKPHRPNLTGTPGALRPTGSTLAQGRRPRATGDYMPWRPD